MKFLVFIAILALSLSVIRAQDDICCPTEFNSCIADDLCQEIVVHCIESVNADLSDSANEVNYYSCLEQNVYAYQYVDCYSRNCGDGEGGLW